MITFLVKSTKPTYSEISGPNHGKANHLYFDAFSMWRSLKPLLRKTGPLYFDGCRPKCRCLNQDGCTLERTDGVWDISVFCLQAIVDRKGMIDPAIELWEENEYKIKNSILWVEGPG